MGDWEKAKIPVGRFHKHLVQFQQETRDLWGNLTSKYKVVHRFTCRLCIGRTIAYGFCTEPRGGAVLMLFLLSSNRNRSRVARAGP